MTPTPAPQSELLEVLSKCAKTFRSYEAMHNDKGPIGAEKAKRNADMAVMCEQAIANASAAKSVGVEKLFNDIIHYRDAGEYRDSSDGEKTAVRETLQYLHERGLIATKEK